MSRNIKNYDEILTKFVFFNLLMILIIMSLINIKNIDSFLDVLEKILSSSIGLIGASIFALLMNGILKTDHKDCIVFWKVKQALPSYRVFSYLVKNDYRIDFDELSIKHNPLPVDPELQHKLWYKLLKRYPDDEMILQSHRDYLLYRDLTAITFLMSVVYFIIFIALKIIGRNISILIILVFLIEYIILVVTARNKAERFVLNVVSCDLSHNSMNLAD